MPIEPEQVLSIYAVSHVFLWMIVVVQAFLTFALLRQIGILNLRIVPAGAKSIAAGPRVGQKAPELNLADIRDSTQALTVPSTDLRNLMIVFISPSCSSCKTLTPGIRALAGPTKSDVLWAVVSFGDLSENYEYQRINFDERILFCHATPGVRDLYDVTTTPYAIYMRPDSTVLAAGIVNHIEHLESMLESRASDSIQQMHESFSPVDIPTIQITTD